MFVVFLQVKVWFQNRRTKFKRTKSDEDGSGCGEKNDSLDDVIDEDDDIDVTDSELDDLSVTHLSTS